MIISVASLTLRFYKRDGWTKNKVKKLLVNPKLEITYRNEQDKNNKAFFGDMSYYAVYEHSGHKVFKKSEIGKHEFDDRQHFNGIDWYINEEL